MQRNYVIDRNVLFRLGQQWCVGFYLFGISLLYQTVRVYCDNDLYWQTCILKQTFLSFDNLYLAGTNPLL